MQNFCSILYSTLTIIFTLKRKKRLNFNNLILYHYQKVCVHKMQIQTVTSNYVL